jgi:cold shock CspA family protein
MPSMPQSDSWKIMPDACAVRPRSMKSRCTAGSRACFPWEEYGFIETTDGQEVDFHKNSVVEDGFDRLEIGGEVRLSVAEGESSQGPQATTVLPAGKHHLTE